MHKRIFVIVLALLFLAVPAIGKSFSLPHAEIIMQINEDSSIDVTETITFLFNGSFSFAYRDIPRGTWQVSDIEVTENEVPLATTIEDTSGDQRITWHYAAENEERTFTIHYHLINAITAYNDVGELNWKVWGDNWDPSLGELYGEIIFPEPVSNPTDVFSWGHPKINGRIELADNRRLIFQVFNIPSEQWIEIRMIFPIEQLSSTQFAIQKNEKGLEKIIEEEKAFLFWQENAGTLSLVLAIIFIIFLLWVYFKYGRDPKIDYTGSYEREPPFEYGPALVGAQLQDYPRIPRPLDFIAEILNLAVLGFLKLERVKKEKVWGLFGNDFDYKIHILQKEDTKKKLALHQIEILQFIVQRAKTDSKIGSNSILFGEIESYAKKNRSSFRVFFESWQDQTKEELKKLQLFERDSKGLWILSIGTISFIGIMILLVSLSFDFLPFVLIWAFLLFIPISLRITTKRTPKGVLHYKKWKNLKKYLKDFTLVKEHSPDGIMLWEKFLVYATTFGIADKVTKYMNELVPPKEFAHSAIFYGTVSASQYAGFGQSFAAFSSSFATSTGTGGSGGFGGGGGGGGGGGAG